MCGSLRLEGQRNYLPQGSHIPAGFILGGAKRDSYLWPMGGFARLDGSRDSTRRLVDQWPPEKWTAGAVKVEGFKERDVVFDTSLLGCLLNHNTGKLRILTREAKTEKEILIHHRAPSRIPSSMGFEEWLYRLNKLSNPPIPSPQTPSRLYQYL